MDRKKPAGWTRDEYEFLQQPEEVEWDLAERNRFTAQVLSVICLQLSLSVVLATSCTIVNVDRAWVFRNSYLLILTSFTMLAIFITVACNHRMARLRPWNHILLWTFTVSKVLTMAFVCAVCDTLTPVVALCITAGLLLGVVSFCLQWRYPLTARGTATWLLVATAAAGALAFWLLPKEPLWTIIISCVWALAWSSYMVLDVNLQISGKIWQAEPWEWVSAALSTYPDVFNVVLLALQMLTDVGGMHDMQ